MKTFCDSYSQISLIKQPTCYKNPSHHKCMNLILTNVPRSCPTTSVIETGLLNFYFIRLTVMRKSSRRLKPRVINYKSYKHFSNEVFRESLLGKLSQQTFVNNDYGFEKFYNITLKILDKYAPRKTKHARGNQMAFMTKDLSKNIMKRSRLRNKYLKNNNEENRKLYAKQRNYCVSLLRKTKKAYYENLDERKVSDDKLFFENKSSLSKKFNARERIKLSENGEIVKNEKETAEVF